MRWNQRPTRVESAVGREFVVMGVEFGDGAKVDHDAAVAPSDAHWASLTIPLRIAHLG
jgi:hypothetical protein